MNLSSMQDLMVMALQDIYSGEMQLLEAAPGLVSRVASPELEKALDGHMKTTEQQARRLEQLLAKYGQQPDGRRSKACEALLREAWEIAQSPGEPEVKDAALIMAQQKFEHNEIAAYGSAAAFAKALGDEESARQLAQIMEEEKETDAALTRLAKRRINPDAEEAAPSV